MAIKAERGSVTGNTASDAIEVGALGDGAVRSGPRTLGVWSSSWNGATATLQWSPDGSTWIDFVDAEGTAVAFTANAIRVMEVYHGSIRLNVTGGGSPEQTIEYSITDE
ncbi:MAG: hypothetical protein AAGE01_19990 [Pseudomonadota bacterium]